MVLYTDSGVTLYETTPRKVTFQETYNLQPGSMGADVYIDGARVTGSGASMALQSGSIIGHVKIRDQIAPQYQAQLSEGIMWRLSRLLPALSVGGLELVGVALAGASAVFALAMTVSPPSAPQIQGIEHFSIYAQRNRRVQESRASRAVDYRSGRLAKAE